MNHLQGKVVVITGASSGLGAVSAKALTARGQENLDQPADVTVKELIISPTCQSW